MPMSGVVAQWQEEVLLKRQASLHEGRGLRIDCQALERLYLVVG